MATKTGTLAELTIASTEAASSSMVIPQFQRYDDIMVKIPAAWTAANLRVQYAVNETTPTWIPIYDDTGVEIIGGDAIPTTGGALISLGTYVTKTFNALPGALFRVVSSDTSDDTDEAQAAARTIAVIGVPDASVSDCNC